MTVTVLAEADPRDDRDPRDVRDDRDVRDVLDVHDDPEDPAAMTPEARLREVGHILAAGALRLRFAGGAGGPKSSGSRGPEAARSPENVLRRGRGTSVHGPAERRCRHTDPRGGHDG